MAEDFDAVVPIRIVRGGDHHSGGERTGARQISHAGRSDDAGGYRWHFLLRQAGGHLRGDPRAGFARVHADEHSGIRRRAAQIAPEGHAEGMHRGRIQGILSRHAANAVRSEQLFAHLPFSGCTFDGYFNCNLRRVLKAHPGVVHVSFRQYSDWFPPPASA